MSSPHPHDDSTRWGPASAVGSARSGSWQPSLSPLSQASDPDSGVADNTDSALKDVPIGAAVLYLAEEEFCAVYDYPGADAARDAARSDDVRPDAALGRIAARLATAAPTAGKEWRRGYFVGTVAVDTETALSSTDTVAAAAVITDESYPWEELHTLRLAIGLAPAEANNTDCAPSIRLLHHHSTGGGVQKADETPPHSMEGAKSRLLISPLRGRSSSSSSADDNPSDGTSPLARRALYKDSDVEAEGPLSLEMLIKAGKRVGEVGGGRGVAKIIPPLSVRVCSARAVCPLQGEDSLDGAHIHSVACSSPTAAAAMLSYLSNHASSPALCPIYQSHPREKRARSVWARTTGTASFRCANGEGAVEMRALLQYLTSLAGPPGPSGDGVDVNAPAVVCLPCNAALPFHVTTPHAMVASLLSQHDGPRAARALACLVDALHPLSSSALILRLNVSLDAAPASLGGGAATVADLQVCTPHALTPAHVSHLAQLAIRCRRSMDADNAAKSRSGGVAALWSFTALLDQVGERVGEPLGCLESGAHVLHALLVLGAARPRALLLSKTMVGVSCLAAACVVEAKSRPWYLSESQELLGLPVSVADAAFVLPSLVHLLLECIAAEYRQGDGPRARASQGRHCITILQVPPQGCSGDDRLTAEVGAGDPIASFAPSAPWCSLAARALFDAARAAALDSGMCRAAREESRAEGIWDDSVAHAFSPWRALLQGSRAGVPILGAAERVLEAALRTPGTVSAVRSASDAGAADIFQFCRDCVALLRPDEGHVDAAHVHLAGDGASYPIASLLLPARLAAAVASFRRRVSSAGLAAAAANDLVREWMVGASLKDATPQTKSLAQFRRILASCTHAVVDLAPGSSFRTGAAAFQAVERSPQSLLSSTLWMAASADVHFFDIPVFCKDILLNAARYYCCCCCGSESAAESARARKRPRDLFTAPAAGKRRALYVQLLRMVAAARYRDAAMLCRDAIPAAARVAVGVSAVALPRSVLNNLTGHGTRCTTAAAELLQRVCRGYSMRCTSAAAWRRWQREQRVRSVHAAFNAHGEHYEVRRQEQTERLRSCTRRAREAVAASRGESLSLAGTTCERLQGTVQLLAEELSAAVAEISQFEGARADAEFGAQAEVRQFRARLTDAWRRLTSPRASAPGSDAGPPIRRARSTLVDSGCGVDSRPSAETREERAAQRRAALERALRVEHRGEEAQVRRAERIVADFVARMSTSADACAARRVSSQHLSRQQQRFAAYGARRDDRAQVETLLLAMEAGGTEGGPGGRARASSASISLSSRGGASPPAQRLAPNTTSDLLWREDSATFAAQRQALSLWEESTMQDGHTTGSVNTTTTATARMIFPN